MKRSGQAWLVCVKDINRNNPTMRRWACGDTIVVIITGNTHTHTHKHTNTKLTNKQKTTSYLIWSAVLHYGPKEWPTFLQYWSMQVKRLTDPTGLLVSMTHIRTNIPGVLGILLKPAGVTDGSQVTLHNLAVHCKGGGGRCIEKKRGFGCSKHLQWKQITNSKTGLQASDQKKKFSDRRQSVFLFITKRMLISQVLPNSPKITSLHML